MTREEAKAYFKRHIDLYCVDGICREAEEMAIQALEQNESAEEWYKLFVKKLDEQEPCDDAISREAAINIASLHCLTIDETVKALKQLPSVTQKPIECEDAISRDALIAKLTELIKTERSTIEIKGKLIPMIQNIPSVTQKSEKWIPVSEGLPKVGISVLVSDAYSDIYFTHITRDGVFFDEWGNKIKGVVAWMPLPKPYEPRESEEQKNECKRKEIEQLPPVTQKSGKWEWVQYDYDPELGDWRCSECRSIVIECVKKEEKGGIPLYKYCPQCGAKMQESEEKK